MTDAEPTRPLRAIVFTPDPTDIEATARCVDHIREHGYELAGIVPRDYAAALGLLIGGQAAILVADRRSHLPANGLPRVEVVAETPPPDRWGGQRNARTRLIPRSSHVSRRNAAG